MDVHHIISQSESVQQQILRKNRNPQKLSPNYPQYSAICGGDNRHPPNPWGIYQQKKTSDSQATRIHSFKIYLS